LASTAFASVAAGNNDSSAARKGARPVYFAETKGFTDCPVYDRYRLRAGDTLDGPAIIEDRESTVVVIPDCTARVDRSGNIIVDLA